MKLSDFLSETNVFFDIEVNNQSELFHIILSHIPSEHRENIIDDLLVREKKCSTGIGHGIAVPHTTNDNIEHTLVLFAKLKHAIDFYSYDSEPVDKVFVLLSPNRESSIHLSLLARMARLFSHTFIAHQLNHSTDTHSLYQALVQEDCSHIG